MLKNFKLGSFFTFILMFCSSVFVIHSFKNYFITKAKYIDYNISLIIDTFLKLAKDAGNMVQMTKEEKERLAFLLQDIEENDGKDCLQVCLEFSLVFNLKKKFLV